MKEGSGSRLFAALDSHDVLLLTKSCSSCLLLLFRAEGSLFKYSPMSMSSPMSVRSGYSTGGCQMSPFGGLTLAAGGPSGYISPSHSLALTVGAQSAGALVKSNPLSQSRDSLSETDQSIHLDMNSLSSSESERVVGDVMREALRMRESPHNSARIQVVTSPAEPDM